MKRIYKEVERVRKTAGKPPCDLVRRQLYKRAALWLGEIPPAYSRNSPLQEFAAVYAAGCSRRIGTGDSGLTAAARMGYVAGGWRIAF